MEYVLTLVISLVVIISVLKLITIGGYRASDTFHIVAGAVVIAHGVGITVFTLVWIWG
jgi:hypothetical protein